MAKRTTRNTVAWWIKFYHMRVDLWNEYRDKWGRVGLHINCYDERDPFCMHSFDF